MKPETKFRASLVVPFLNTLRNTAQVPIQQLAIVGDPDFVLCMWGRFVALELKDVGEVPRPIQEFKLQNFVRCGGVRFVADRSNWVEVKQQLSKMDKSKEEAWKGLR